MNQKILQIVESFISKRSMFTVYDVHQALNSDGYSINYSQVRKEVESLINDNMFYKGYTRTVGSHIPAKLLNKNLGNVGAAPQVYHHHQDDYRNYLPNQNTVRRIESPVLVFQPVAVTQPSNLDVLRKTIGKKEKGLFKFDIWVNGKLRPCNFIQVRGDRGKFLPNQPYQAVGVLDDGSQVTILQDQEGKLYAKGS